MTFWSEQGREDVLRKLAADGFSASQIAAEVGTTRNSVISRAHRRGIKLGANRPKAPPNALAGMKRAQRDEQAVVIAPKKTTANWSRPSPLAERAAPTPLQTPVAAAGGKPVPFLDRRIGQCCWPLWGANERTGMVCAASTGNLAESYCAAHRAVAFTRREAA